jgi:hypothetical protein
MYLHYLLQFQQYFVAQTILSLLLSLMDIFLFQDFLDERVTTEGDVLTSNSSEQLVIVHDFDLVVS